MDFDFPEYSDAECMEVLMSGKTALTRLIALLKDAHSATTKEEAERFIKEIQLADFQAKVALDPKGRNSPSDIKSDIRNRKGDFAKLTDLYQSLGAI